MSVDAVPVIEVPDIDMDLDACKDGGVDISLGAPKGALLAGVDEVGRGPLAGDVVACAVILDPDKPLAGLTDSKRLSEKRREHMADSIRRRALCYNLGRASVEEIDAINILQATMLAMVRAVDGLAIQPEYVLVDGNRLPDWQRPSRAVVKGDSRVPAISAASIVAKVTRDGEMRALDGIFPGYDFAGNKGYGTRRHLEALARLGPCDAHRRSFRPVIKAIRAKIR